MEVVSEIITNPTSQKADNNRDENTKKYRSLEKKSSKGRKKRLRCKSSRDRNEQKMSAEVANVMIRTPTTQELSSHDCNVEKTCVEIVKGAVTTPTKEKRMSSEDLCFRSLSDCISTIERDLKNRVEESGESMMRSRPLTGKNLFRISDFYAEEAEVVDEDEMMSIDENVANNNTDVGDFINDSDSFSHVRRPNFDEFTASTPDIRIGRLRVVDLARKHVKTRSKNRKRRKRKKWTLSTSSESQ